MALSTIIACYSLREPWMALAAVMAQSLRFTICSSSSNFSDKVATRELVESTNLFAASSAEHSYDSVKERKHQPYQLLWTELVRQ